MKKILMLLLVAGLAYGQQKSVQDIQNVFHKNDPVEIAKGNITGRTWVFRWGENTAVGTTVEDVTNLSGTQPYLTSNGRLDVVATGAVDSAGGTGLTGLVICGLDSNWAYQTETVVPDGGDTVTTTGYWMRVWDIYPDSAGSGGRASDDIKIQNTANSATYLQIDSLDTRSRAAIFTVPASKTFYLTDLFASTAKNDACTVTLFVRRYNTAYWKPEYVCKVYYNTVHHKFDAPLVIPAKADISVRAVGTSAGNLSAGFSGWYQ